MKYFIEKSKGKVYVDSLPAIDAIPVLMRQLFQNIISNALKYSKADEAPVISISSKWDNDNCTILIKDNGIGFENIYAEKIFVIFQRLQTTKREEGTGIGLAICKRIVETHRGSIKAVSEEGVGTTFIIDLPLKHYTT